MAILKNPGLGFLSGKKGNDVFRTRKGKTTVSPKPGRYNYNPENQKNCIAPKNKFGFASWFAKFNNTIPELKLIWKKADVKGDDAYHKMISYNINKSEIKQLTVKNVITPPGMFLKAGEVSITGGNINAHLEILDEPIVFPLKAIAVIYSFNPRKKRRGNNELVAVIQEIHESVCGMKFDLTFPLEQKCINAINRHPNWIIYFAFVKDDLRKIVWTSTAAVSGVNPKKVSGFVKIEKQAIGAIQKWIGKIASRLGAEIG